MKETSSRPLPPGAVGAPPLNSGQAFDARLAFLELCADAGLTNLPPCGCRGRVSPGGGCWWAGVRCRVLTLLAGSFSCHHGHRSRSNIIFALEQYDDGATPGLVGPVGKPFDVVHQQGAKERLDCARAGHLHRLSRGAAQGASSRLLGQLLSCQDRIGVPWRLEWPRNTCRHPPLVSSDFGMPCSPWPAVSSERSTSVRRARGVPGHRECGEEVLSQPMTPDARNCVLCHDKIRPDSVFNLKILTLGGTNSVGAVLFARSPPIVISLCGGYATHRCRWLASPPAGRWPATPIGG